MTTEEQLEECERNIRRLAANIYDCDDCQDCSAEEVDAYWAEMYDWSRERQRLRGLQE